MRLPLGLSWEIEPAAWQAGEDSVTTTAAAQTDYFIDPAGAVAVLNGARAMTIAPEGSWQFSARVSVGFQDTYDAGVLMIWSDETHWAKLCFERSPQEAAMIVSVITREVSDDANAWVVSGDAMWLRISHLGQAYAFHASEDGERWDFVRYFALHGSEPVRVGIQAQAPMGEGCVVTFDRLALTTTKLGDLRDGS